MNKLMTNKIALALLVMVTGSVFMPVQALVVVHTYPPRVVAIERRTAGSIFVEAVVEAMLQTPEGVAVLSALGIVGVCCWIANLGNSDQRPRYQRAEQVIVVHEDPVIIFS